MKEQLIGILGLNKHTATEESIVAEVEKLVMDLRGKMGYVSMGLIEKLKREGYFKFDGSRQSWKCELTDDLMRKITNP